jgi:hypothetical protein
MVYMYCGQPNQTVASCDARTAIAVAHAASISAVVFGSHRCRLPEFDAEDPHSWCDYGANFSSSIARLKAAGIRVFLNAAGAHHFATMPFVTGEAGKDPPCAIAVGATDHSN